MCDWEPPTSNDLEVIQKQLARKPQRVVAVVSRCRFGAPQVVVNSPLLLENKPVRELPGDDTNRKVEVFPTLFWLTCPYLRSAIGRLESAGWVKRIKDKLAADQGFRSELQKAHEKTAQIRKSMLPEETINKLMELYPRQWQVIEQTGIAGMRPEGITESVKCLHAHFADYLALKSNPVGRLVWGLLTAQGVDPKGWRCDCEDIRSLKESLAIIDIGSNSLRLLIGRLSESEGEKQVIPLYRDLVTTRLGGGLLTGKPQTAMDKSIETLKAFKAKAGEYGVRDPIAFGTAALREAEWAEEFLIRAWEEAEVEVRVLSGQQEATLSFLGAQIGLDFDPEQINVVVDIGGGSTEIIVGSKQNIYETISLPIGAVRLKLLTEKEDTDQMAALVEKVVKEPLKIMFSRIKQSKEFNLIAVGGTATSLAAMDLKLTQYDSEKVSGHRISLERLGWWINEIKNKEIKDRRQIQGLQSERADIILQGAIILHTIVQLLSVQNIVCPLAVINDSDLMQGMAQAFYDCGLVNM
jgi:exopolyphosphatase/guanosine-5'-triphosphate,3'-diphosphate pyrophosphatase